MRLIEYDAATKTHVYHEYDHSTQQTHILEVQDVRPYLEMNKKLASCDEYKRQGIKEDWYHFASVPNSVLMKFLTEHNLDWRDKDDLKKIEKLLQSNEYSLLRTVDRI